MPNYHYSSIYGDFDVQNHGHLPMFWDFHNIAIFTRKCETHMKGLIGHHDSPISSVKLTC